jgi:hypothetical protein
VINLFGGNTKKVTTKMLILSQRRKIIQPVRLLRNKAARFHHILEYKGGVENKWGEDAY